MSWKTPCRFFLFAALAGALHGEVSLAAPFTDHAVLQRERADPVWGRGDPGEKITVQFHGATVSTVADGDGRWFVLLPAGEATREGADLVAAGRNTVTCHDVVVGEVWLASGQSNMEFTLSRADHAAAEIAAATNPLVRVLKVGRAAAPQPADTVGTRGWQAATPQSAPAFTAVGYFFARDLQAKLGIPIGVIDSTWGGTPVESWMSASALAGLSVSAVVATRWEKILADFPAAQSRYEGELAAWKAAEAGAGAPGSTKHAAFLRAHPAPRAPIGPESPWRPGSLFNGMINPLLPFGLRGVIWYQGESNASHPDEYHELFSRLIRTWRTHFANEEMPFFWVNLPNYRSPEDSTGRKWAWFRAAQTATLELPHTGQAVAIDLGNPNDIHPTNKQEVGRRLALLARHRVYGFSPDDTGPTFVSATPEGAGLRVRFAHAAAGLVAHDRPVQALEIAGADRKFYPATARIDRDTLLVSAPQVPQPVAVRYAWSNSPGANLYGGSGLPAVPFRSDSW